MRFKSIFISTLVGLALISGNANAKASAQFKNTCAETTASLIEGLKLLTYYSDANASASGVYITASDDRVWMLSNANGYPYNVIVDEFRKIAIAAVMTGMKVNICASAQTSPNTVWSIELDGE